MEFYSALSECLSLPQKIDGFGTSLARVAVARVPASTIVQGAIHETEFIV